MTEATEMAQNTRLRQAAVLLASLPDEDRCFLLSDLDEEQVAAIAQAASTSQPPLAAEQDAIARELRQAHRKSHARAQPRCPTAAAGHPVTPRPKHAKTTEDGIGLLFDIRPRQLASLLAAERPQTVALILSYLPASTAAAVLEILPTETQMAVAQRIGHLGPADEESLGDVVDALRQRIRRRSAPPAIPAGGASHVALIIHHLNRATERALLENLSQEDRELTDEVRQRISALRTLRDLVPPRQAA